METNLDKYEIVKAYDLKVGDTIIHNHSSFRIDGHSQGRGAGNEFGEYISIIGSFVGPYSSNKEVNFWSFENCPVIRFLNK